MKFGRFDFGSIRIDGQTYGHDVVIDGGEVRKRRKGPSKRFREEYGHTPLSVDEALPWRCKRLVIGSGAVGALPVMSEVERESKRRDVELVIRPTREAVELLRESTKNTNAVLHVTC